MKEFIIIDKSSETEQGKPMPAQVFSVPNGHEEYCTCISKMLFPLNSVVD